MKSDYARSAAYEHFTPSLYDRLHARFLRMAGGEGQSAIEGAVTALLKPGLRILDAGCGTGRLARRLLSIEPELDITLLDLSPRLLRAARDLPVRRIYGDMTNIALSDNKFDLSLALWSVEASEDPARALRELARVTKDHGHICLLFCATREDIDLIDRAVQWSVIRKRTGIFLDPASVKDELAASGARAIYVLESRGPAIALLATMGERK